MSAPIASAISDAYLTLRKVRDVLAAGNPLTSSPYQEARAAHSQALRAAREAMRHDLDRRA